MLRALDRDLALQPPQGILIVFFRNMVAPLRIAGNPQQMLPEASAIELQPVLKHVSWNQTGWRSVFDCWAASNLGRAHIFRPLGVLLRDIEFLQGLDGH